MQNSEEESSPPTGPETPPLPYYPPSPGEKFPHPAPPKPKAIDHIVIAASVSALLAVAVTLTAVWRSRQYQPAPTNANANAIAIAMLQKLANDRAMDIAKRDAELARLRNSFSALGSMRFAELTGTPQPNARGRFFIDAASNQWYFFVSGMKLAASGTSYQLSIIAGDTQTPAASFQISQGGSAALFGSMPVAPAGNSLQVTVTQEPLEGTTRSAGIAQIDGTVQDLAPSSGKASQPSVE
jgi:hypothetical protein